MKQKVIEESDFQMSLGIQNNSTVEFKTDGMKVTSGKVIVQNNIEAKTITEQAFVAIGTLGSWQGLVGHASWSYTIPKTNELAVLTLKFDMPYDGGNSASFTGNSIFKKYFNLDPNIVMPTNGNMAQLEATININKH